MVCGQLQAPPVLSLGESGVVIHCTKVQVDLRADSDKKNQWLIKAWSTPRNGVGTCV